MSTSVVVIWLLEVGISEMDDNLWIEALKQGPALAFMVYIVQVFLGHIAESRKDSLNKLKEITDSHREFQSDIAAEHRVALVRVADVIDKNSATLGRAGYALDYLSKTYPNMMPKNGSNE